MPKPEIIMLLYAICVIVITVAIIWRIFIYKKHLKIVKNNSELYSKALNLNSYYAFHSDFLSEYKFYETCASKRKLENLSLEELLLSKIDDNFDFFKILLLHIQENNKNYEIYCKEYGKLSSDMNEDKIKGLKIRLKTFIKIEHKLYNKIKLNPQLTTSIYIKANYTSPKGRNSYNKEKIFSYF